MTAIELTAPNGLKIPLNTGLFINNEWVKGSSGQKLASIDPATEETICEVEVGTAADIDTAVRAARTAFTSPAWAHQTPEQRRDLLNRVADLIDARADQLFALQAWDVGKPLAASMGEAALVTGTFRYYAGWADKLDGKLVPVSKDKFGYTLRQPVGVCGAITPWNYPLANTVWKLAPALAVGCCMIVKPSECSALPLLFLAQIFKDAGCPPGVVQVVNGYGGDAGAALTAHLGVDKIAFTGSTATGKAVIKAASANLKKTTIEAGGKSAFLVFEDADLQQAAKWAVIGGIGNAGQICSANSRILVHEAAAEQFVRYFSDAVRARKIGSPFDKDVSQGPQVSKMQYDKVLGYIRDADEGGATLVCGGKPVGGKGYFIEPTIYTGVTSEMKIFQEEIFGPVIGVTTFKTLDEAVALANDSPYGLAAMLFTQDLQTAHRAAARLDAGMVWINESNVFDPKLGFGGVKQSGLGREMGESALESYIEEKVVHVNLGTVL